LRALGIDVRDAQGNIRQLDEMLPELADKFSQFANGSNKAALAAALFGEEAGPKMLALLSRGKAGLEEIRRTLGSTYTQEDVERVRNYQLVIANLQVAFEQFFGEIARAAGPTLTNILRQLTEYISRVNNARAANERDSQMARAAADAYDAQAEAVRQTQAALDNLAGARARLAPEKYAAEEARLNAILETQKEKLNQLASALALLREGQFSPPAPSNNLPQAPKLDPFALEKAQLALDRIMERLSGQRDIFDSINLSWEEHSRVVQQALAQIDRTYEQGHRREAARHRLAMEQRRQEQQGMLDTATAAANAITALWPKQKGAAIAAAIINTAVGVTNALKQGVPPWNFAQAALIAAAGAAQISQIRSTSETGASSTTAPTPTAEAVPTEEAGPSRSLFIQGVDPAAFFSGRQVEELIRSINTEVQNGATLIATRNLPI
jgi:hypothetical protein